tara:strand:+ start:760 stop:1272 length:513 start_codon:yes stop_codon:yes gene_type:complete
MPNWVTNTLTIEDTPAGKILADFLASCITNTGAFMPVIRPFPAEGHRIVKAGDTEFLAFNVGNELEEGQIDGREWAHDNWGTKWGDCRLEQLDELVFGFDSAWGFSMEGILALSAVIPEAVFTVYAIEEQPCFVCKYQFQAGNAEEVFYINNYGELSEGNYPSLTEIIKT